MPIRVRRTRHAPDGREVPLESDAGLTVLERRSFKWPKAGVTKHAESAFLRYLGFTTLADGTQRKDTPAETLEKRLDDLERKVRRYRGKGRAPVEGRPPLTLEWFADEVLKYLAGVRRAVKGGDASL